MNYRSIKDTPVFLANCYRYPNHCFLQTCIIYVIKTVMWIRIRIGPVSESVPDPDPEAQNEGKIRDLPTNAGGRVYS